MTKEIDAQIKPKRAKTNQTDHKQPTDNMTDVTDIMTGESKDITPRLDIDRVARLWIHGLTNNEIMVETGFHIQTVRAYVRKIEREYRELPADMLKSKVANTVLKLLLDSDMILRRYSIALSRVEGDTDNKTLPQFITIARALESQAKTLTDCLVRMGVGQSPVKDKGTPYPHSPNDTEFENLTPIEEGEELVAYHKRRAKFHENRVRGLTRSDTKQNKEVDGV